MCGTNGSDSSIFWSTRASAVFRRTARRYSLCAEDAEDAYQRSIEILLTKAPPLEGDAIVRWMQVVTKREALAVRIMVEEAGRNRL